MKKIIAIKEFTFKGESYIIGDEIKVHNFSEVVKLNEKGFIEPLNFKDLTLIQRELENSKKYNKEEE